METQNGAEQRLGETETNTSSSLQLSHQEVERKWRVSRLPDLTGLEGKDVIQGYIAVTADGTEVRVRQKGDKYFHTI